MHSVPCDYGVGSDLEMRTLVCWIHQILLGDALFRDCTSLLGEKEMITLLQTRKDSNVTVPLSLLKAKHQLTASFT
jgi:hypothetical protein